eukprot:TRINITY_DN35110_c0_g1_i1.p1 TRINITY_DN35110_c0_g1~~TRINITY_DN35110_c0_g1_i1.p1  ORF type:complete len:114 (+),score=22.93 TRINITY_DN35110_c0_g1_i1:52-342(+)
MLRSLVGSEMCIRDRAHPDRWGLPLHCVQIVSRPTAIPGRVALGESVALRQSLELRGGADGAAIEEGCLLYTSDAADEEDRVDLCGGRNIKNKRLV